MSKHDKDYDVSILRIEEDGSTDDDEPGDPNGG